MFFGAAVTHDAGLDLEWRVLAELQSSFGNQEQCHAAHVRQLERSLDIGGVENFLNRRGPRLVPGNHAAQLAGNFLQPGFKR